MESAVVFRERLGVRALSVPAAGVVAILISLSAVVRFFAALYVQTPFYLPDEYTYSAIARGIAQTGRPVIRTAPAHFPALLEPLLAAPFWLTNNPELAFRLTQAEHAVVMSLGAIPLYLLCRRLGLDSRFCVAAVLIALVSPDFALSSLVLSEPVAYPLVLGAVYAAVIALGSPSRKAQLAVVLLVSLAVFARVQYVVLVPVVVIAALVVARGDVRRFGRTFGLASSLFGLLALLATAMGPGRVLGSYAAVFHLSAPFATIADQAGTHLLLAPLAAGIVLVPGAIVGLALTLKRPRTELESAFAAITVVLALALIAQAVFIASTLSGNFGERYIFFFFPLLTPAYGLYVRRSAGRAPALLIAAGLAVLAVLFPLSHYLATSSDSTMLLAFTKLAVVFHSAQSAALAASLVAVLLAAVAAYAAWRGLRGVSVALTVAVVSQVAIATAAGLTTHDIGASARSALPSNMTWIDDAHVGDVTLVGTPGNNAGAGVEAALWNTSITSVARLPGATRFDPGRVDAAQISRDGSLTTANGPIAGAVLVDRDASWLTLSGARRVRTTLGTGAAAFDLWQPTGNRARVAALAVGVRGDGWLSRSGTIEVWPSPVAQRVVLRLSLPGRAAVDTIHFTGSVQASYTVTPEHARTISLLVPASSHLWKVRWRADRYGYRGRGKVSFVVGSPRLVAAAGPLG